MVTLNVWKYIITLLCFIDNALTQVVIGNVVLTAKQANKKLLFTICVGIDSTRIPSNLITWLHVVAATEIWLVTCLKVGILWSPNEFVMFVPFLSVLKKIQIINGKNVSYMCLCLSVITSLVWLPWLPKSDSFVHSHSS